MKTIILSEDQLSLLQKALKFCEDEGFLDDSMSDEDDVNYSDLEQINNQINQ